MTTLDAQHLIDRYFAAPPARTVAGERAKLSIVMTALHGEPEIVLLAALRHLGCCGLTRWRTVKVISPHLRDAGVTAEALMELRRRLLKGRKKALGTRFPVERIRRGDAHVKRGHLPRELVYRGHDRF
jgi:hypothetical protein